MQEEGREQAGLSGRRRCWLLVGLMPALAGGSLCGCLNPYAPTPTDGLRGIARSALPWYCPRPLLCGQLVGWGTSPLVPSPNPAGSKLTAPNPALPFAAASPPTPLRLPYRLAGRGVNVHVPTLPSKPPRASPCRPGRRLLARVPQDTRGLDRL
jgi:hypothetical protein